VRRYGFHGQTYWLASVIDSAAFLLMIGWWARRAWAHDPVLDVPSDVLRRIGMEETAK
jgi:hypothetical protein